MSPPAAVEDEKASSEFSEKLFEFLKSLGFRVSAFRGSCRV